MKQRIQESPRKRFDRLTSEMAEIARKRNENSVDTNECPTVLVEVSGGMVQNVRPLSRIKGGIRVLVRDHDNLKACPEAQDEVWQL